MKKGLNVCVRAETERIVDLPETLAVHITGRVVWRVHFILMSIL